jgi:tRNA threonylcarbamoyladenosine biosynthesis protein TsaE
MSEATKIIESGSVDDTRAIGRRIGTALQGGEAIALIGGLGAGKTQFVKGLALGAGVGDPAIVNSPTFVIVNEYEARVHLHHIDAYRLSGPAELEAIGVDEMFSPRSAVIIEWADRVHDVFPADRLTVSFAVTGSTCRRLTIQAAGPRAKTLIDAAG